MTDKAAVVPMGTGTVFQQLSRTTFKMSIQKSSVLETAKIMDLQAPGPLAEGKGESDH